jgi:hypothetical protein
MSQNENIWGQHNPYHDNVSHEMKLPDQHNLLGDQRNLTGVEACWVPCNQDLGPKSNGKLQTLKNIKDAETTTEA